MAHAKHGEAVYFFLYMNCTALEIIPVTCRNEAMRLILLHNRIFTMIQIFTLFSVHLNMHIYTV